MEKKKGFTFIETVLTIVVVGIIAGVAAKVLVSGLDIYALIVNRNKAVQMARVAMDRMVGEMLLVRTADITAMTDLRFGFVDKGGASTDFKRTMALVNGVWTLCLFRGNDFMVSNSSLLDFDYLRADGTPAYSITEVRRINIDFTIQAAAMAGAVRLRTEVFPRYFMYSGFE